MFKYTVVILILIFSSLGSEAQDERYYQQLLGGDLALASKFYQDPTVHKFNVVGSSYLIDLNGDKIEEVISPHKKDGIDYLEIKDSSGRILLDAKLFSMGSESFIYKIKILHLSATSKVMVVFLDEGHTLGRKFESSGRIFLITIDKNDLSTMKMTSGPHLFHEKSSQREQYFRRDYRVLARDMDQDGLKEIVVEFDHIQRILIYKGSGEWERF